eukprot:14721385-Alexandrium_andersonii.AAC.1
MSASLVGSEMCIRDRSSPEEESRSTTVVRCGPVTKALTPKGAGGTPRGRASPRNATSSVLCAHRRPGSLPENSRQHVPQRIVASRETRIVPGWDARRGCHNLAAPRIKWSRIASSAAARETRHSG